MNVINDLSFYVHKITRNQTNIFSSGGPMLGCLSYYFLAELHTLRTPEQNETVNGMFTLYKVIFNNSWFVKQTGYWILMDGDMNNKFDPNYISSAQINKSNKFFEKYHFLNLIFFFSSEFQSPQTHEFQTCWLTSIWAYINAW